MSKETTKIRDGSKMKHLLLLILLGGCVHKPTTIEVFGPNGESYSTVCKQIVDCYNEAHSICQGEYVIVDSTSKSTQQLIQNGANPIIVNRTAHQILYECK